MHGQQSIKTPKDVNGVISDAFVQKCFTHHARPVHRRSSKWTEV